MWTKLQDETGFKHSQVPCLISRVQVACSVQKQQGRFNNIVGGVLLGFFIGKSTVCLIDADSCEKGCRFLNWRPLINKTLSMQ